MTAVSTVALAAAAVLCPNPAPGGSPVQGIVLIVVDDFGTENLDWWPYGVAVSNPPPTPNLEALAASGVTFTRYFSQPVSGPARASLMSGRHPFETGLGSNPTSTQSLATSWESIPSILSTSTNVTSAAFGKWQLGAAGDWMHPNDLKFSLFVGTESDVNDPVTSPGGDHYVWTQVTATSAGASSVQIVSTVKDEATYSLAVTGSTARQWISQQTGRYFAYVSFNVPRAPHQVPPLTMLSSATVQALPQHFVPGYTGATVAERRAIHKLAVEAVDTEIGRMAALLDPGSTVLLVAGSHGTRAPLVAAGIVNQVQGECTQAVSVIDVRNTIVELASGTLPTENPPSLGVDFTPLIKNPNASHTAVIALSQRFTPNGAYTPNPSTPASKTLHDRSNTNGVIRYLRFDFDPILGTYVEEAYDIGWDPEETDDLLAPGATPTQAQIYVIQQLQAEMTRVSGA